MSTISVVQVLEAPPVVAVDAGDTEFTGDPVAVAPNLVLTEPDHFLADRATVAITDGLAEGDVLAKPGTQGNIAASYDADTGVLTLTSAGGTATIANWQAALRAVTYTGTDEEGERTITFTMSNAVRNASTPVTKTVTIAAA